MPLRAIVRLVAFVLLVVLAVCGLAIAVFAIGGSRSGDFNLPGLARLVHLGDLRDPRPASVFSNDELKSQYRGFEDPDTVSEPRFTAYRNLPLGSTARSLGCAPSFKLCTAAPKPPLAATVYCARPPFVAPPREAT